MQLSDGERMIVVMLAEVTEHFKLHSEVDPTLVKKLVIYNDFWALRMKYPGLFDKDERVTDQIVSETIRMLEMWSCIESSISTLPNEHKIELEQHPWSRFPGFEGHYDRHYRVAITLIEDLNRFDEFSDRTLHTQIPVLHKYWNMLQVFNDIRGRGQEVPFTKASLLELLNA